MKSLHSTKPAKKAGEVWPHIPPTIIPYNAIDFIIDDIAPEDEAAGSSETSEAIF
jgi:hypothetical protein